MGLHSSMENVSMRTNEMLGLTTPTLFRHIHGAERGGAKKVEILSVLSVMHFLNDLCRHKVTRTKFRLKMKFMPR